MVIGANPTDGHPVFASFMKRRLREGAKLIVVDPRRIDLVRMPHVEAQYHLKLRPGTNVAILTALAHVVVTEGLANDEFVRARCEVDSYEQWKEFVARPEHSPEATEEVTGVPASEVRAAARLYATGGNAAIYYGLGVTEHSQGSTAVIGIANLAMATGNIGREGVGVNPLRGQNNVQGSCDMGSFPHEYPGYRHVLDDPTAGAVRVGLGRARSIPSRACGSPTCSTRRSSGTFKGLYRRGRGHRAVRSQHPARHRGTHGDGVHRRPGPVPERDREVRPRLLPGQLVPGEGRHLHQRRAAHLAGAQGDASRWAARPTGRSRSRSRNALGYPMTYTHPSEIMDEIAMLTPTFTGVSYEKIDRLGSIQWPCNDQAPEGTPVMHRETFVRGKGKFLLTEYVPTEEKVNRKYPLILTTGRILSQYNVGAQTRRTANVEWHDEDRLEIHPHDAEERGINEGDWVGVASRAGETDAARPDHRAGAAGRGLHHVPPPGVGRQRHHHRELRLGHQLPGVQGHGGAGDAGVPLLGVAVAVQGVHRRAARPARRATAGMNVEHLLTMANQIGQFYQAYPNRDDALKTAAMHVRRSWDPRMRRALLEHLDAHAGQGLDEFMLEAVRTHRAALTPAENVFPPPS